MIISGVKWEKNTWCNGDVQWRKGERRSFEGGFGSRKGLEVDEVRNSVMKMKEERNTYSKEEDEETTFPHR